MQNKVVVLDKMLSPLRYGDPDLLVICTPAPTDSDFDLAKNAVMSGHRVLHISERAFAPSKTRWLSA